MNELIALALRRAGVNTLAEFQALQGLPQTGEADPETQLALDELSWITINLYGTRAQVVVMLHRYLAE